MARRQKRRPIRAREWQGFKDFGLVAELFDAWPAAGPRPARCGMRPGIGRWSSISTPG